MTLRCIVLLGGELNGVVSSDIPDHDMVVAVDSGLHYANQLELSVDLVVGDFDSANAKAIAAAEMSGTRILQYPPEKDLTDFELCLDELLKLGATEITVVGGMGGRFDHSMFNVLTFARPDLAHIRRRFITNNELITVVQNESLAITGNPGDTISLIPLGGPVESVKTQELLYPLTGEPLYPFSARSVSNRLIDKLAHVEIRGGVVAVVQQLGPSH